MLANWLPQTTEGCPPHINLLTKIGLTGGIASGKTAVSKMFAALGAHVIHADEIAHQLMRPGERLYHEIVRTFGREVLHADANLNRGRLAELAFEKDVSGKSRIEELNKIVHPSVIHEQNEWMAAIGRANPKAIAVVEAALILEAGAAGDFDRLVVVTCSPHQRIERWARRVGCSLEEAGKEVSRRMAAQFSDEIKIKAADYVIDNSGSLEETQRQVETIFTKLK